MTARILRGLPAAPGTAAGPLWIWVSLPLPPPDAPGAGAEAERRRLEAALLEVEAALQALAEGADRPREAREILEAQQLMLRDPDLWARVEAGLREGRSAERAFWEATEEVARTLEGMENPYFQARAADVRDVGRRVVAALLGKPLGTELPDHPVVLAAEELFPSDAAALSPERVLAVVTAGGGPTAHAAILARRLGIPAVVGLGEGILRVPPGTPVLVDGDAGQVYLNPEPTLLARAEAARARRQAFRAKAASRASAPARTRDRVEIPVLANVGSLEDARAAAEAGADGIGLLRTEFLYLGRSTPPTEEEQVQVLEEILALLAPRPVTVRTLDAGGDKPLPYLDLPDEANPFLGERGVRLYRRHPDLFRTQLRALLAAAPAGVLQIMVPMVAAEEEVRWAREEAEAVARALGRPLPPLGIMVEVPSAALLAGHLARIADFFSLGTNDLAQYTLAADRTHPRVAALADGLHPAVLALIARTVEGARRAGIPVGICGELAADPLAVPVLLGLGVTSLSVNPVSVPEVKEEVRRWSLEAARALAQRALELPTAAAVRDLVRKRR